MAISDATSAAIIYFTSDGTTPTTESQIYSGPFTIPGTPASVTVRAIAIANNLSSSTARTDYTIAPVLPSPTFSPAQGNYSTAQNVTISSPTKGGVIHYTTDGSAPTTGSPVYSGAVTVTTSAAISALVSGVTGYTPSQSVRQNYAIFPATPYINPAGGTYTSGRTVAISDNTPGAVIYYTTDGSAPTTASAVYNAPLTIPTNPVSETVRALAIANGLSSSGASAAYVITPPLPAPVFSVPQGSYSTAQSIALTSPMKGGVIHYTTDGSWPTVSSPVYSNPIVVTGASSIDAFVSGVAGYTPSPTIRQSYAIFPATPYIYPAGGTFVRGQTVTISDSTPGAVIYYTTDGSAPTTTSAVYHAPLTIPSTSTSETVRAVAAANGLSSSGTSAAYVITPPLPAPVFSVPQGNYSSAQNIEITSPITGGVIHYTTDGSWPTVSSPVYSKPITVTGATSIDAFVSGVAGYTPSPTIRQSYAVFPATPYINPAGGTFARGQTVTISDSTSGAVIHYTTDGSTPSAASPVYNSPIATPSISGVKTIKAVALANGLSSSVASNTYTITPALPSPVFSPAQGNYSSAQNVTIASPMPGGVIHYTTDGSFPTASSPVYSAPIAVTGSTSIFAFISGIEGYTPGPAVRQNYAVYPATPYISPAGGTFTSSRNVAISCSTPGSVIYYTTDGTTPTAKSPVYSAPLTIPSSPISETVKAIAQANGLSSSVGSVSYTIAPLLPAPSFSPAQGTFDTIQYVTISSSVPGSVIHYTTDGSPATMASPAYSGPIKVTSYQSIAAIVSDAPGYTPSQLIRQNYAVTLTAAIPAISPGRGAFPAPINVSLSDSTPGATIYYTTDGSLPTTASPIYANPIPVSKTTAVKVMAVADGYLNSPIGSNWYGIQTPTPVISPGSGTFSTPPLVTITNASPTAVMFYTTDGSTPTTSSTPYTGPFLMTSQTGTQSLNVLATSSAHEPSPLAQANIVLGLPAGVMAASAVVASQAAVPIPSNFLGLSHEWGPAQAMMGDAALGVNNIYRTLIGQLSANMNGPIVVRIGGVTTDATGAPTATTIQPFEELSAALNVRFILGINLGSDDLALAQSQASTYLLNDSHHAIDALEIGNEPDVYSSNGNRPSNYGYANFLPEYQKWALGIKSATALPVTIAGPAFGTGFWVPNAHSDLGALALTAGIVTQHKYIACYDPNNPLPGDLLLQPASSTGSLWLFGPYAATAHSRGEKFRIGEMNSVCRGGQPGLSNSFSSALWSIDAMFELINAGVDGVNWNSNYDGGVFDLFHFRTWQGNGLNAYSLTSVNPLYYGLLLFSQAAGHSAQLLPLSTLTDSNVKVWATTDAAGNAHLIVINKEKSAAGKVQMTLPGYSKGQIVRLTASSYQSTSGVAIGGQTFDGSQDGTIQGSVSSETVAPANGVWTISVDPTSAVLVNLQP